MSAIKQISTSTSVTVTLMIAVTQKEEVDVLAVIDTLVWDEIASATKGNQC